MSRYSPKEQISQLVMHSNDLNADIQFFEQVGFRLDQIYPADNPQVAIISGNGMNIKFDQSIVKSELRINILTDDESMIGQNLKAPNGADITFLPLSYKLESPPTQHKFEVRKLENNESWVIGRAGMLYRDLIPDRLGGSIIASHIHIPTGGPVPDMVHYHTIGFQLIFCYQGWVKLVYEDQGPPFILKAGECVTQPPEIRHRVLEASDNLEVIEIGIPSDHMTTIDHEMKLPNNKINLEREYQGQKFVRHQGHEAIWEEWHLSGLEVRNTGVDHATQNLASVHVIRANQSELESRRLKHDADILFRFIMAGNLVMEVQSKGEITLSRGDAYVLPPGLEYMFLSYSDDLEFLEVALPGNYRTTLS